MCGWLTHVNIGSLYLEVKKIGVKNILKRSEASGPSVGREADRYHGEKYDLDTHDLDILGRMNRII